MSTLAANVDPTRLYDSAARAEQARDWDTAFRLYVRAAEAFLRESRAAAYETRRSALKAEASKALTRAEKIKAIKGQTLRPVVRDPFAAEEQARVLQRSSMSNGLCVPLWDDPRPTLSLEQPSLSPQQEAQAATWRLPSLFETASSLCMDISASDVVQDVISDCSLCASIITCLEHRRRFQSKLLGRVLTLRSDRTLHARLFLNGAHRRIAIDQLLPMTPDGRLVCLQISAFSDSNWPALVEKAYLKAVAGYDFRGSDSATDILALLGWIPEHLVTRGPDFAHDRTWNHIFEAFNAGSCLVTLGTGNQSDLTEAAVDLGLIQSHCYAVISIDEVDDDRQLMILNHNTSDESSASNEEANKPMVIRLAWEDACNMFDGIYISWDPQVYAHQLTFHGLWMPRSDLHEDGIFASQGELHLVVSPATVKQELVVVLLRHVVTRGDDDEYIALHARREEVFSLGQDSHVLGDQHAFTTATYVTVRVALPPSEEAHKVSIVTLHEGIGERETGYTVLVYSHSAVHWEKPRVALPFSKQITNTFTSTNTGGNSTYPTFMNNPQYRLQVHPSTKGLANSRASDQNVFNVVVRCGRDMPVNIMLVWSGGSRVFELAQPDVAMESGAYTYGFASTSGSLRPGQYTLIISGHSPRHHGPFQLSVESVERFDLEPIPQEGAGMYSKSMIGDWSGMTAAGGPSSGAYTSNPIFELSLPTSSKIIVRLQLVDYAPAVPLNVTLFPGATSGTGLGRHIATSGSYSDALPGVSLPETQLAAGSYVLVPSTFRPGVQARFRIIVYSSVGGLRFVRKQ